MSGAVFSLRFDADQAHVAAANIHAKAGDLSPLMDQIGALLEQSARDRIEDTNETPEGVAWPVSFRASLDGGKTLFESGRLAASLTHIAGRDSVEIGSNLIYAGTHQDGATIVPVSAGALGFMLPDGTYITTGKVTIPARPYLGVSADDGEDITDLVTAYLLNPDRAVQ